MPPGIRRSRQNLARLEIAGKGAALEGKAIHYRDGSVANLGVSEDGKWMLFDLGRTLQCPVSGNSQNGVHAQQPSQLDAVRHLRPVLSGQFADSRPPGAPEGRMQLWCAPDETTRAFEVRQFATKTRTPVTCCLLAHAGKGGPNSFAVSVSGANIYVWSIPTPKEVSKTELNELEPYC